ncbi:MAG: hemolysin III family protein [Xanthomonadales bacterium]|nr:hemolysin III family protein [Xanthomonadales bacterium]
MTLKVYSAAEERINIGSHALGLALSTVALLLLILKTLPYNNTIYTLSFSVFGASLICLYLASTLYHSAKTQQARTRLRIVDHATIYILIAGTYTPVCLITLAGPAGWIIFTVSWSLAVIGVALKLFFTGHFERLSTLMYVFMGWIVIFVVKPMIESLPPEGLAWLVAGGLSYTLGAVIYSIKKIPFNHAIFHGFVLAGSVCHFISVYLYVLPP